MLMSQRDKYCMTPFYEEPGVVKPIETESRTVAARSWGRGMRNGELVFKGAVASTSVSPNKVNVMVAGGEASGRS